MYNIKLFNKISPDRLKCFEANKYTCGEEIENPDAIIVRSASMNEYEAQNSLKAIARAGAGVNNIPIDKFSEKGIVVFNTPGANANAVKELVIMGILVSSRKIIEGISWAKTIKGNKGEVPKLVEKEKDQFAGQEIKGRTLGVIGLGAIGILVANAAKNLGMQVYGYDPFISVDAAWNLSHSIIHAKTLSEIYQNCDYISIHVPCNNETKGMINAETIATMKDGVKIINFARAELVNENDIIEALKLGKVSKYVVDFPTDGIIDVENVVAIPHLGASTVESEDNCATMASHQIKDYLENGNIKNSVNFPNVEMEKTESPRICVIHKNIPNMLAQISGVFSKQGINIDNMINRSKKDYAYSMLDVSCDNVLSELVSKIEEIDGIIRVRVIE